MQHSLTVRHLMTAGAITIRPDESAGTLAGLMERHRIRHLLVTTPDNRLLGVVSQRDLLRRGLATQEALGTTVAAATVMSHPVESIGPDEAISSAAGLMFDRKLGCLPVIDEDQRVIGILTEADFVRSLRPATAD